MIACEVVWAEVASGFGSGERAGQQLELLGVGFSPLSAEVALASGDAVRSYRSSGAKRERVIAGFLVGAHAAACADRLLTRDRGFYRSHFAGLSVFEPAR